MWLGAPVPLFWCWRKQELEDVPLLRCSTARSAAGIVCGRLPAKLLKTLPGGLFRVFLIFCTTHQVLSLASSCAGEL